MDFEPIAGSSARAEAERAQRQSRALREQAARAEQRARSFSRGASGEARTAELLSTLSPYGFHLLHDRQWPGSTSANIDHLVVGPSGVFVVDTKNWSGDVTIDDHGIWQGQDSRNDVVERAQQLADLVRDGVSGLGLPPTGVRPVIALIGRDLPCTAVEGVWVLGAETLPREILRHGKHLTQQQTEVVLRGVFDLFPPAAPGIDVDLRVVPTIDNHGSTAEVVSSSVPPQDALFTVQDLEDDALTAAMASPLEDWMIFLHPKQADFARRKYNGPALLRGAAGTGKTVVALHRLAYLAERRSRSLLYLSFVRTLPAVQRTAFRRLSPHTVDRVEFTSLHAWALKFVRSRGMEVRLDGDACDAAYRDAWNAVGAGSVLDTSDTWMYWNEEVKQVIRGRRLTSLGEYQGLSRSGRGSRLGSVQREAVWRLKEAYEDNLRVRNAMDWDDLLERALQSLKAEPLAFPYDTIVVDEVQDLTRTGVELVSRMAATGPDSLLLVGDSNQAVFAGGVSPREAGISVRGRSTVLSINYRNTAEVLDFAAPLVADSDDVLGDDDTAASDPVEVVRHGLRPIIDTFDDVESADAGLIRCMVGTQRSGRCDWDGMAVLASRRRDVYRLRDVLSSAEIPFVDLESWSGDHVSAVKLGTVKRAKGLEFLYVYLPSVAASTLPGGIASADDVDEERLRRARRELYVAATRARDGLWIGVLAAHKATRRTAKPRVAEVLLVVPPVDGLAAETDVYALARRELLVEITGGPARFREQGWYAQGLVPVLCDVCSSPLYAFRRPYEVKGKQFKYWAIVCRHCQTAREPRMLPEALQKAFRKMPATEPAAAN